MRHKFIFVLIFLFIPTLLFSQKQMPDRQIDDLLARFQQVKMDTHDTDKQLKSILTESNLDDVSPVAIKEISHLLRLNSPEHTLRHFLEQIVTRDIYTSRKLADAQSESILNKKPTNQPSISNEQITLQQILEDFKVNDNEGENDQIAPTIAVDTSGNFMIVWSDLRNGNSDIYAQFYNNDGTKQGTNFLVNDDTGNSAQSEPVVAVDENSNFVVVWTDARNGDSDIYAQRYTLNGVKQGTNFQINDEIVSGLKFSPAIAKNGSGNFVVVWVNNQNGKYDIYGQQYTTGGTKQGGNFQINDVSGGSQHPALMIDKIGNFMVVWSGERLGGLDILAQRYFSNGQKNGTNFLISDAANNEVEPDIATDSNGNYVVVWRCNLTVGSNIIAQRYTKDGTQQGGNFLVNDDNIYNHVHYAPKLAIDYAGNFVIAWEDYRNSANPAQNPDIYAQPFDKQGNAIGTNYRVNTDLGTKDQGCPNVRLVNNYIHYTWQDNRLAGQGYDIFARVDRFNVHPIYLTPIVGTHELHQEFWIDIQVKDVQNLFGMAFKLNFPADHLEALSAEQGDFLGSDLIFFPTINNATGSVTVGMSKKGGQGGSNGTGIVTRVKFKEKASTVGGTTINLSLTEISANDPYGEVITLTPQTASYITPGAPNTAPGAPVLVTPSNNSTAADNKPILTWNVPTDLDGNPLHFKIEIATDDNFTNPISGSPFESKINSDGFNPQPPVPQGTGTCSFTIANALANGDYWWRVSAWDGTVYGNASESWKFAINVQAALITPIVGTHELHQDFYVDIQVKDVQNLFGIAFKLNFPATYLEALAVEAGTFLGSDLVFFPDINNNAGAVTVGMSKKSGQSSSNGTGIVARIKFKEKATTASGIKIDLSLSEISANNPAGDVIALTPVDASYITPSAQNTAPGAPVLVSPSNNSAAADNLPVLTWNVPTDVDGNPLHFKIEIATDNNFVNPVPGSPFESKNNSDGFNPKPPVPQGSGTCCFTVPNALANGDFWWRVSAWDGTIYGAAAAAWKFAINVQAASLMPIVGTHELHQDFYVDIQVKDVQNLFGIAFKLNFPATYLEALAVETGTFLGSDLVFFPDINNNAGAVTVGMSKKSGQSSTNGTGIVARIKFKEKATTASGIKIDLTLSEISANDPSGGAITITPQNASYTTPGAPNTAPGAPVLVSPSNNSTAADNKPVLTWNVPTDLDGNPLHFKIEIATDNNFVNPVPGSPFESKNNSDGFNPKPPVLQGTGTCSFTIVNALANGDYWWRVSAWDGTVYGSASESWKFVINVQAASITPIVGTHELHQEFYVDIQVKDVQNLFGMAFKLNFPANYLEALSAEAGDFMGSDLIFFPTINNTAGFATVGSSKKSGQSGTNGTGIVAKIKFKEKAATVSGVKIDFTLSEISANDPSGGAITITPQNASYTTPGAQNTAPEAPVLVSPSNNSTAADNKPMLTWNVPTDVDGNPLHFKIEIATDNNFTNPISGSPFESKINTDGFSTKPPVSQGTGTCSFTVPSALTNGNYWWRVSAWDGTVYGAASESWKFAINVQAASLTPIVGTHELHQDFYVDIQVKDVQNLFGIAFKLNFPATYLEALAVEAGTFLGSDLVFFPDINNNAGAVTIGMSKKSGQSSSNGTGIVARIKFKEKATTVSSVKIDLTLSEISANDPSGGAITITPQNASYTTPGAQNTAPEAPVLVSPSNNSTAADNLPVLTWNVPTDVDGNPLHFKIEIATDDNFVNPVPGSPFESKINTDGFSTKPPVSQGAGTCSFTVPSALTNGNYWWRVSAWDGTVYGAASESWKFAINVQAALITPIVGTHELHQDFYVDIQVKNVQNLFGVAFKLNFPAKDLDALTVESGDFLGNDLVFFPEINNSMGTVTVGSSKKSGQNSANGTGIVAKIKFKEKAATANGVKIDLSLSEISANDPAGEMIILIPLNASYTTSGPINMAPGIPQLVSPANNSLVNVNLPVLTWNVPADINGDLLHFKVEIATDNGFNNMISGSPFESHQNILGFNPMPPIAAGSGQCSLTVPLFFNNGEYYWRITAWDGKIYGTASPVWKFTVTPTSIKADREGVPTELVLYPNHPNPFNPTTSIRYALPDAGHVSLQIYDVTGRMVRILIDSEQTAGEHSVLWDAKDDFGQSLANGIYLCRIMAGKEVQHRKMILAK